MKRKIFIKGMTCMKCVNHVKVALESIPNIEDVQVDLADKSAMISGNVSEEVIIKALSEKDYEVINIQEIEE